VQYLTLTKGTFVVTSIAILIAFSRHIGNFDPKDLGSLHRYIQGLLFLLILFNDPFFYYR